MNNEDLYLDSVDEDIPFEGLDYETILNHNIIYNAIKRKKYKSCNRLSRQFYYFKRSLNGFRKR